MSRRWGTSRATVAALVASGLALAGCALMGYALTGCTQAGGCGQAIRPNPSVSVDVTPWIAAHPGTNVRVCVEGNCVDGSSDVVTYGNMPVTPFHDGDTVAVTVEPIQGSTAVDSFTKTVRLVDSTCGQWGARLKLTADGAIRADDR